MKDNNKSELGLIASKLDEIENDTICLSSNFLVLINALFDETASSFTDCIVPNRAHEALMSALTQLEQIIEMISNVHHLVLIGCKNNGTDYADRLRQYEKEKQKLLNECKNMDASIFAKRLEEQAALYNI